MADALRRVLSLAVRPYDSELGGRHELTLLWVVDRVRWWEGTCSGSGRESPGGTTRMGADSFPRPYKLYETIDLVYGPAAFLRGDGFTSAQGE